MKKKNIGKYAARTANPYKPAAISDYVAVIAREAARQAVLKPDEVTGLTDYKTSPAQTAIPDMIGATKSVAAAVLQ